MWRQPRGKKPGWLQIAAFRFRDQDDKILDAQTKEVPHLAKIDDVPENDWQALPAGTLGDASFRYAVTDHYLTNPIARASQLMSELSANAKARSEQQIAAE